MPGFPFFQKLNFDTDSIEGLGGEIKRSAGAFAGFAGSTAAGFSWRPFIPNIPDTTIVDPLSGRPVYNTGTYDEVVGSIGEDQPKGVLASSALEGVAAGSQFGLPGMAIGGALGTIKGLLTKGSQKRKVKRATAEAEEDFEASQEAFGERDIGASMSQEARIRAEGARRNNFNAPTSLI